MEYKLRRISVLKYGIVTAILSAIMGFLGALIIVPISMAAQTAMNAMGGGGDQFNIIMMLGWFGIIIIPIMYAVFGFIAGCIGALIYNLVAKWTGGYIFTLEEQGGSPEPMMTPAAEEKPAEEPVSTPEQEQVQPQQ